MTEVLRDIQPFHTKAIECTIDEIIDRLRAERYIASDRGAQTRDTRCFGYSNVSELPKSLIPLMASQDEPWSHRA